MISNKSLCSLRPASAFAAVAMALLVALPVFASSEAASGSPGGYWPVKVKGVGLDPFTETPIVVLEDSSNQRAIPIWIGFAEAEAIASELHDVHFPRPKTHDLIKSLLERMEASIARIVVTDLKDNTYYAVLVLKTKDREVEIDARPSDAIAVALRTKSPIYVTDAVMGKARQIDLNDQTSTSSKGLLRLGFRVQSLTPALAEVFGIEGRSGVLVSDVKTDGAAFRAGLRRGDAIVRVNETVVKNVKDFEAELSRVGEDGAIEVQIIRNTRSLPLTLWQAGGD